MARIQRRRQQNQAGIAGATQASHERQDDRVSPGTPNQQNKPEQGTGDDRPELHVHEGQAGDQPYEKVDDDKKVGQGGVQPTEFDADISNLSNDAPDVIVEDDNNKDERAVLLAPMITPHSTQRTSTRYWVSP
jgi:hypothetical protein